MSDQLPKQSIHYSNKSAKDPDEKLPPQNLLLPSVIPKPKNASPMLYQKPSNINVKYANGQDSSGLTKAKTKSGSELQITGTVEKSSNVASTVNVKNYDSGQDYE